jgi:hypothetical protein
VTLGVLGRFSGLKNPPPFLIAGHADPKLPHPSPLVRVGKDPDAENVTWVRAQVVQTDESGKIKEGPFQDTRVQEGISLMLKHTGGEFCPYFLVEAKVDITQDVTSTTAKKETKRRATLNFNPDSQPAETLKRYLERRS